MLSQFSTVLSLTVLFVLIALPVCGMFFAWKSWRRIPAPKGWRRWMAFAALLSGSIGTVAAPFVLLLIAFHKPAATPAKHLDISQSWSVLIGMAASLLGVILSFFAYRRVRWLVLFSCLLALAICYITAMSLPY
ncbi:hypothetical protein [Paracidobacterium acidisoli]|uniref:Uncharacterized protein n=1 Tax=Paracidobacterium acidisoli TaxID=2303751 RepID=A0A372IQS5_9BACT|nr:hypothetical protein [Paracidobacterium acidisoli]MBT9331199.1 hypothetical protein [Paracidobacterium acidisoli]